MKLSTFKNSDSESLVARLANGSSLLMRVHYGVLGESGRENDFEIPFFRLPRCPIRVSNLLLGFHFDLLAS